MVPACVQDGRTGRARQWRENELVRSPSTPNDRNASPRSARHGSRIVDRISGYGLIFRMQESIHGSAAFAEARSGLEREWDRGEEVSTEDLRIAFRRYGTFFDHLLDV